MTSTLPNEPRLALDMDTLSESKQDEPENVSPSSADASTSGPSARPNLLASSSTGWRDSFRIGDGVSRIYQRQASTSMDEDDELMASPGQAKAERRLTGVYKERAIVLLQQDDLRGKTKPLGGVTTAASLSAAPHDPAMPALFDIYGARASQQDINDEEELATFENPLRDPRVEGLQSDTRSRLSLRKPRSFVNLFVSTSSLSKPDGEHEFATAPAGGSSKSLFRSAARTPAGSDLGEDSPPTSARYFQTGTSNGPPPTERRSLLRAFRMSGRTREREPQSAPGSHASIVGKSMPQ